MGPSGAGKSTLLRCLNRLIELAPGLRVDGEILFRGRSIFHPDLDVDHLRARIGILFPQPAVFPTSIRRNILFGVRHLGRVAKSEWAEVVERSLKEASLWEEVRDRLDKPDFSLMLGR